MRLDFGSGVLDPTVVVGGYGVLPGPQQTVPRSEVYAGLMALRVVPDGASVLPVSDNLDFVNKSRLDELSTAGTANADVWSLFWAEVMSLGRDNVAIAKVKSNESVDALADGRILWWQYVGNEFADRFAAKGRRAR